MNTSTLKLFLLGVMIVATLIAGLFPVRILKILRKRAATAASPKKQRYVSLTLCLLTCFSGGVFLATCFLHLLPELQDHFHNMQRTYNYHIHYPIAELLSCVGFFLLFSFEEIVLILIPSIGHGHVHGHSHIEGAHSHHHDHQHRSSSSTNAHEKNRLNASSSDTSTENNCCRLLLDDSETQVPTSEVTVCKSKNKCPSVALAEPERCETNCENVEEHPPILMKSHPHAHSHGIRSITFVLAISIHSIVEGLALGVQKDNTKVTSLFLSLMVHKLIVAFSVGLQLARTHAHALRWVIASIFIISVITPLGALIGMFVQHAPLDAQVRDILVLICQGIAVGTFIYVTFFEVLIHERDNEHPNLLKILFMIIGFTLIGCLRLLEGEHAHFEDNSYHSHDSIPGEVEHHHNH
jgi:zinc transporter 1/2/3